MLLGPLRAVTYLFMHGLVAWCLGGLWQLQARWQVTVAVGSLARLLGQLGYLAVTSWTLNENLFRLLLANVYSLLVSLFGNQVYSKGCVSSRSFVSVLLVV